MENWILEDFSLYEIWNSHKDALSTSKLQQGFGSEYCLHIQAEASDMA